MNRNRKDYRRGQDKDKFERKQRAVKRQEREHQYRQEADEMLREFRHGELTLA